MLILRLGSHQDRRSGGALRWPFVRFLVSLALLCGRFTGAEPLERQPSASSRHVDGVTSSYGPYWTTRAGLDTRVTINSPDPNPRKIKLEVIEEDGGVLWEEEMVLAPLESRSIGLRDLVGKGGSGYLKLTFDEDIGLLPAGATTLGESTEMITTFIDEKLLGHYSSPRVGFIRSSRGRPSRGWIVAANVGSEDVRGEVTIASPRRTARFRWKVAAGESSSVAWSAAGLGDGPLLIRVECDRDAKVLFTAISDEPRAPRSLRLVSGYASSGTWAAFRLEGSAELTLANLSYHDGTVRVLAGPEARERRIFLPRGVPVRVPLGTGGPGIVQVKPEGEMRLAGEILSRYADESVSTPLADGRYVVEGHSFPLRLGDARRTQVLIFNPHDEAIRPRVVAHFEGGPYSYPVGELAPGEFMDIDLREAALSGLPGIGGSLLPDGEVTGHIKVFQNHDTYRRLMAMAVVDDYGYERRAGYQSGPVCPPILGGIDIIPQILSGVVGSSLSFSVFGSYTDLSSGDVTFDSFYSLDQPIATVLPGLVSLTQPGTTTLRAEVLPPSEIPEEPEEPESPEGVYNCVALLALLTTAALLESEPCQLSLQVQSPDNFRISTAPEMPTVNLNAMVQNPPNPTFSFSTTIQSGVANLSCSMNCQAQQTSANWTPDFTSQQECMPNTPASNPAMRGGTATFKVTACSSTAMQSMFIGGDNPSRTLVRSEIGGDETAKKIACQESCQEQFESSGMPVVSGTGAVGVMQITTQSGVGKTCDDVWNWKVNVSTGLASLGQKRAAAGTHHQFETQFNQPLVNCINDRRAEDPSFNFAPPPLSAAQREREAIRRYNSGREHQWEVTNLMTCEGEWKVMPQLTSDPDYVVKVLNRNPSTCQKIDSGVEGQSCAP